MTNAFPQQWSIGALLTRPANANWSSVILWWEIRRIPYNIMMAPVGMVGVISHFFLVVFSDPSGDTIELWFPIVAPVLGAIFFNVCYTSGWVVELLLRSVARDSGKSIGPMLFIAGLALSLAIVLLPSALMSIYDLTKLVHFLATGG